MSEIADKIRAYVNDTTVSDHYGDWGILRRDQRILIRKLCDTCDMFERAADELARKQIEDQSEVLYGGRREGGKRFAEMCAKAFENAEAHPENYDDMFAGYENDLNKAVALIECQKQEIVSLTIINKAYGLAVKRLAAERSEWISVGERLPEEYGDVICYTAQGSIIQLVYNPKYRLFNVSFDNVECAMNVTHWMPLPEAPKMKGGEE